MGKYIPRHIREKTHFTYDEKIESISDPYENLFKEPDYDYDAEEYVRRYRSIEAEFHHKTGLTSTDLAFIIFAAAVQTLRWYMLSNDAFRFDKASDADKFFSDIGKKTGIKSIEDIIAQPVPYDAIRRSERFKAIYPELSVGIAGTNHRYTTLGHDPLIGLIVGTGNIATGTLCVNNWTMGFPSYHVVNSEINGRTNIANVLKWTYNCAVDEPQILAVAFLKQLLHMGTDVFTKQGLPLPIINSISPEASKFLLGPNARIDVYSTVRSATLAILVNNIVSMLHRYFYNQSKDGSSAQYEVRTMKVVMYSNVVSSLLNVGYVGVTKDFTKFDLGGIAVTLWNVLTSPSKIRKLKYEFINKCLEDTYRKEEEEVNVKLAEYGYRF